jgi:hypothetical protein
MTCSRVCFMVYVITVNWALQQDVTAFSTRSAAGGVLGELHSVGPCGLPITLFITLPLLLRPEHHTHTHSEHGVRPSWQDTSGLQPSGVWHRVVQIFGEIFCLLLIHPEDGINIFHRTTKLRDITSQNTVNTFSLFLIWVWNLVCHINGKTWTVFENTVLRNIFVPKKGEVAGE